MSEDDGELSIDLPAIDIPSIELPDDIDENVDRPTPLYLRPRTGKEFEADGWHNGRRELVEPPHNFDAEQALLGAIMINNSAFERVAAFLEAEHFAHPVHAEIYRACGLLIDNNKRANPLTLKPFFEHDEALKKIGGGWTYLTRLATSATTVINAGDYGRIIFDCWQRRGLIAIAETTANEALAPVAGETAIAVMDRMDSALLKLSEGTSQDAPAPIGEFVHDAVIKIDAAFKTPGKITGISCGYSAIDSMLGGLQPGELIVIAGRPSMGKSDVATNIAENIAKNCEREGKGGVLFESLEMGGVLIGHRLIAKRTSISAIDQRSGNVSLPDFHRILEAERNLSSLPLVIDESGSASLTRIRSNARRLKRQNRLTCIVIDYLQRMPWPKNCRDENTALQALTKGLKSLAMELHIPVILLSQLSRGVESRDNKRPRMDDLRGSGAIEQDADIVAFVYRDEYYLSRAEPDQGTGEHDHWEGLMDNARGLMEFIIAKQRMGAVGTVRLYYNPAASAIYPLERRPRADGSETVQGDMLADM